MSVVGTGVVGTQGVSVANGVVGPGVQPAPPGSGFAILMETGDPITTESSSRLETEDAP